MRRLPKEPLVSELTLVRSDCSFGLDQVNLTFIFSNIREQFDEQVCATASYVHQRALLSKPHAGRYSKHLESHQSTAHT